MGKPGGKGGIVRTLCAIALIALFAVLILPSSAQAFVPNILSFQGRLTDSSGNLLGDSGTTYYFRFRIYDDETGGALLWSSSAGAGTDTQVFQGVFNVLLGDPDENFMAPLPTTVFSGGAGDDERWLEVDVCDNGDPGCTAPETMSPRQRIAASGYALVSENVLGGDVEDIDSFTQSGLGDCDLSSDKITYDLTTGKFICATDATASGGNGTTIEVEEFPGGFNSSNISSLSFDAGKFSLTASGFNDVGINLDWGPGGPASLSQDETVTGNWEFRNGASFSSITLGGQTVTSFRPASNSIDWDEIANAMTLDANTTTNLNGNTLNFGGLSLSGNDASVADDFEVAGTASASSTFGSGLSDCDGTTAKLLWNVSTGLFSCGTDLSGSGSDPIGAREGFVGAFTSVSSLSFNAPHFDLSFVSGDARVSLDWGPGGPASLSQDETVTGNWEFRNGASFSSITLGGQTFTTFRPASNSLDFDEFENAMDLDANTTITGGTFALTFDHASVSGTLEIGALVGAGLTDCDGTTSKLLWDATTRLFSCGTDQTGSGFSGLEVREGAGVFTRVGSMSFNAPHFVITFPTASESFVSLDWGAGGPASLSQDETVTGNWEFRNGASFSSITLGGQTFTSFRPASNSIDWDEIVNAMTLDANTTTNLNGNTLNFGGLTLSGTNASISGNLEIAGFVSASSTFGSGLTDCDAESQTLLWDATTGHFSCGSDAGASGGSTIGMREGFVGAFTNFSSISFNAAHFALDTTNPDARLSLDWGAGGPASLSQDETVTGHWTFANGASFSGPVEFANGASFSSITLGGQTFTTLRPASNSLDFDEFTNAMTVDAATTINAAAGLTFSNASVSGAFEVAGQLLANGTLLSQTGALQIADFASISNSLEITGYSSSSFLFGSGLSVCTSAQKLQYNANGTFSCVTDQTGSTFAGIGVREDSSATFQHITSVSFAAPHFNITYTASQAFVRLDWGAGGPASLSQDETVTGHWTFANGASFSGPVEFANGASFSSITLGGQTFTTLRPASNSLDFDEFTNAMTVDAATTINAAAGLTFTNASVSGTFETALLKATTIDSDTNQVNITANATVSGNFEVTGYASASATYGSGLTNCNGVAQKLLWSSATGLFSCGTDLQGTSGSSVGMREGFTGPFTNKSSISFNDAHFNLNLATADAQLSLDWGAGGPASLSQNETVTGTWTFSNSPIGNFRPASNSLDFDEFENAMDLDANTTITGGAFALTFDHASVSGAFEVAGQLLANGTLLSQTGALQIADFASISNSLEITGYSSSSFLFGSGLSVCTSAQKLQYNANGTFSCVTDQTGTTGIKTEESDVQILAASTILNFDGGKFTLTASGTTETLINLDWGAGGPASLSQNETVAGTWQFTNASASGTFETALLKATTIDSDTNLVNITANATVSGNFEVTGYASASATFGSGLTDCDADNQALSWNISTGFFGCGDDDSGAGQTLDITLLPEYAGAVMSSISGSCTTCIGSMTSDNQLVAPFRNFYRWTTTQAASQSYDIWVKVDLPNDFSSFSSVSVEGFRSSTTDRVYFAIFDSTGTQSTSTSGKGTSVATANGVWTTTTITAPAGTYTAGTSITFRIRMEAGQNQNVRVGRIRLEYLSSF